MTSWRKLIPRSVTRLAFEALQPAPEELLRQAVGINIGGAWAEDRATRGRDPSADQGQDRCGRHDAALSAYRDWLKSDKSISSS
jgi:hypothetical protein